MTKNRPYRFARTCALASLAALAAAWPAVAHGDELAMLEGLDRGAWDVRFRDGGQTRRVCLRDGSELIQLRHSETGCSRFVVDDTPTQVTVQYTCRGNGYGRTTIRKEGNRLVQLRSQGIVDGVPFSMNGEARYVGRC